MHVAGGRPAAGAPRSFRCYFQFLQPLRARARVSSILIAGIERCIYPRKNARNVFIRERDAPTAAAAAAVWCNDCCSWISVSIYVDGCCHETLASVAAATAAAAAAAASAIPDAAADSGACCCRRCCGYPVTSASSATDAAPVAAVAATAAAAATGSQHPPPVAA